jgi:DNA (cytosine-5)-methyltransferase 1
VICYSTQSTMNYYNEHDPKAAAWLSELIRAGEIPPGDVDERDIQNVKPTELAGYAQCHFFAGIGGWPEALRLAGWPTNEPVWTGSCPCQPFSVAGEGKGTADERHLWPVFAELIRACKPPIVFGEQVASKAGREWLAGVFADLEGMGYQRAGADLCAAGVGAPHIRQRLYWLADANRAGRAWARPAQSEKRGSDFVATRTSSAGIVANTECAGLEGAEWNGATGAQGASGGHTSELCCTGGIADSNERADISCVSRVIVASRATGIQENDDRMADADVERLAGESLGLMGTGYQAHWLDCDLLPCLDGKIRRIESGTFPLADGIPGRVGLLRGYGNAIVPQVASEFIGAWLECCNIPVQPRSRL